MSASLAIKHARAVRQRLRRPPNAVVDHGVDLRRKPEPALVNAVPPAEALPLGIGTPLPEYVLTYALTPAAPPALSIGTIQRAVCEHYGVAPLDLLSHRRTKAIVLPRAVAMWLCRRLTPHSLPTIGRHFGDRDHTTVLHSARRIDELRRADASVQAKLDVLIAALAPAGA